MDVWQMVENKHFPPWAQTAARGLRQQSGLSRTWEASRAHNEQWGGCLLSLCSGLHLRPGISQPCHTHNLVSETLV